MAVFIAVLGILIVLALRGIVLLWRWLDLCCTEALPMKMSCCLREKAPMGTGSRRVSDLP